jgi:hypothetical protein
MPKVQNPKLFEIALQVGGSHYPEVDPQRLEKYGEAIIRACAEIANNKPNTPGCGYITKTDGQRILDHFELK